MSTWRRTSGEIGAPFTCVRLLDVPLHVNGCGLAVRSANSKQLLSQGGYSQQRPAAALLASSIAPMMPIWFP